MSRIHTHDPSTRSGRPLKHDIWYYKAAQEYLIAWKEIMHKIVEQYQVLGLPLNPEPPAEVYYYGHGLRRHHYAFQTQLQARALQTQQGGNGPGGSTTFADPGHPSISWFNGLILDTGNPDAQYFPNAPGNFSRMDQVYSGYNVLISDGVVVVVAASDNLATGQPISATNPASLWQGSSGGGGDESAVSTNPFSSGEGGFYSWNWYSLHDILPTLYFAQTVTAGFETWDWSSSEPGVGGTGNCPQNERLVNASINTGNGWQSFKACVDTGTPVAMIGGLVSDGGGGGSGSSSVQMRFDPNPNPIDVPYDSRNKGLNFIPAYHMSKRIKMALTKDYTIVTSLADPNQSITYSCSGGTQQGDSLQGREWPV